jgi:hypothetical protein
MMARLIGIRMNGVMEGRGGSEGSQENIKHEHDGYSRPELGAATERLPHFAHRWHDPVAPDIVNFEIRQLRQGADEIAANLLPNYDCKSVLFTSVTL